MFDFYSIIHEAEIIMSHSHIPDGWLETNNSLPHLAYYAWWTVTVEEDLINTILVHLDDSRAFIWHDIKLVFQGQETQKRYPQDNLELS